MSEEESSPSLMPTKTARGVSTLGCLGGTIGGLGVIGVFGVRLLIWMFAPSDPPAEHPLLRDGIPRSQAEDPTLVALRRAVISTFTVSGQWTSYHVGVDDTVQNFNGQAKVAAAENGKLYLVTPRETLDLLRLSNSGILRLQVNRYAMSATAGSGGKSRSVTRFGFVDRTTAVLELDITVTGDTLQEDKDYWPEPAPYTPAKWYPADQAGAASAIRDVWGKRASP